MMRGLGPIILLLSLVGPIVVNGLTLGGDHSDHALAKRETTTAKPSTDNQLLSLLLKISRMLLRIPFIGHYMYSVMTSLIYGVKVFEASTNGFLGRILGGSLPCTISLENGIICEGLSNTKGGLVGLAKYAVNSIPFMPSVAKQLVGDLIAFTVQPFIDVVFGGLEE